MQYSSKIELTTNSKCQKNNFFLIKNDGKNVKNITKSLKIHFTFLDLPFHLRLI